MAEPTVMICLGAQKAGTSWLYSYLRSHPDCHLRSVKELHYFDTLGSGGDNGFRRDHLRRRDALARDRAARPFWRRHRQNARHLRDLDAWLKVSADPRRGAHGSYMSYLCEGRVNHKLVADITPSYGTLQRTDFAEMLSVANDVRLLYVMRDPVERLWSQARMDVLRERGEVTAAALRARLDGFIRGRHGHMHTRADYARTLEELSAAVPEDRLMLCFYEELFTPESIRQLCAFLGIRYRPAPVDEVVHGGVQSVLGPSDRRRLAQALRNQYDACAARFGAKLPAQWRANMMES